MKLAVGAKQAQARMEELKAEIPTLKWRLAHLEDEEDGGIKE
jgi:hypothetical protein